MKMDDAAKAYEKHSLQFLQNRDKSLIGSRTVEKWTRTLSKGATVLELACGGGYPVTQVLDNADLNIWAVESSQTLAGKFKERFPHIPVQNCPVQASEFFNRTFDASIAIGLVFLLEESEQTELISSVSKVLNPGGRFLFTAPVEKVTWTDLNTGVKCSSQGQENYQKLLQSFGFTVLSMFTDSGENNYYETRLNP